MREYVAADFVVICAVNDRAIFDACVMRSPDVIDGALQVVVVEGATTMAGAYNEGLRRTGQPICIFAHQDIYFPIGWLARAVARLNDLERRDDRWEVAGSYGVRQDGRHVGRIWDVNLGQEIGAAGFDPTTVVSLDEIVLILKRRPDYRFDEALPHFHLYGTDMVQSALAAGRSAYAVELPVVHNNRPLDSLAGGYTLAYRYARRKWARRLPIPTTICTLSYNPYHLWRMQRVTQHNKPKPKDLLADAKVVARMAGYEP